MPDPATTGLPSDFRRRLLIDRHSSILSQLPLRRQAALADPVRRDAELWNVFRTLAQLEPSRWLPRLLKKGRLRVDLDSADLAAGIRVSLWKRIKPPPERLDWLQRKALRGEVRPTVGRMRKGRVIPLSELKAQLQARARNRLPLEEPVEVDVVIKTRGTVLFVQSPSRGEAPDTSTGSDRDRTYLLRLIDAGLAYTEARARAQRRCVRFALLILPHAEKTVEQWEGSVRRLRASPSRFKKMMPHRSQGFEPTLVLRRVGVARWSAVRELVAHLRHGATDELEAMLLRRLLSRSGMRPVVASRP